MSGTTRRDLFKGAALLPIAAQIRPSPARPATRPLVISSANGLEAVRKAYAMIAAGSDPLDAVLSGVQIVEDDPDDVTGGYGGDPNEAGGGQVRGPGLDGG